MFRMLRSNRAAILGRHHRGIRRQEPPFPVTHPAYRCISTHDARLSIVARPRGRGTPVNSCIGRPHYSLCSIQEFTWHLTRGEHASCL